MSSTPRLSARAVSVDFPIRHLTHKTIRSLFRSGAPLGNIRRDRRLVKVAGLDNINLELNFGDRVGILGVNGAGKTTLLRVLAGLLPPTRGRVMRTGTLAPLLSIQMGFDPNLDGYGNIRLRARLMGHSRQAVEAKMDDIAAFTDIGDHLHLPLSAFSSGMRLRLAFAVATAFDPDILLLDEWISAGDERFREAAAERLNALIDRAGVFAFASHSRAMHERLCGRGVVLKGGRIVFDGPIGDALAEHKRLMEKSKQARANPHPAGAG